MSTIPYGDGENRGPSNPLARHSSRPGLAPARWVGQGGSLVQHVIDAVEMGVVTVPRGELAEAIRNDEIHRSGNKGTEIALEDGNLAVSKVEYLASRDVPCGCGVFLAVGDAR